MVTDGIVVLDQQYTVPGRDGEIPAGYFRAETGTEHPANELCSLHAEAPPEDGQSDDGEEPQGERKETLDEGTHRSYTEQDVEGMIPSDLIPDPQEDDEEDEPALWGWLRHLFGF